VSEELLPYDHRRVGVELDLFHIQEEAAGSVFWHPHGFTLFRTIETYIRDRLRGEGYVEVRTPQLVSKTLWEQSGHWDKFRKNMFLAVDAEAPPLNPMFSNLVDRLQGQYRIPITDGLGATGGGEEPDNPNEFVRNFPTPPIQHEAANVIQMMMDTFRINDDEHQLGLKPMNCPCHVQIFNSKTVSYRQLPWRMAEFGCCHRNEPSGALHGIMRVRQFTQDDAHIFCTEDQVMDETRKFIALLSSVYKDFGFDEIKIGFSTRPDVRAGSDADWDRAEQALSDAVKAAGLEYEVYPGEGAFYGPKLEFALRDLRDRVWQCGTLQLDMVLPKNLGAEFTDTDGSRKPPVMLHRAILGSMERFIGILLEHYEGRLPPWLSPAQYVVIPVSPEQQEYADSIQLMLSRAGVRGSVDNRDENFKQKIKEHSTARVPFILVVGGREVESSSVTVRRLRDGSYRNTDYQHVMVMPFAEAQNLIDQECKRPSVGECRL
jgi:threonyl-tRNA synthetase